LAYGGRRLGGEIEILDESSEPSTILPGCSGAASSPATWPT